MGLSANVHLWGEGDESTDHREGADYQQNQKKEGLSSLSSCFVIGYINSKVGSSLIGSLVGSKRSLLGGGHHARVD